MINRKKIVIGGIYKHPEGTEYRVDELLDDVTDWESTGKMNGGAYVKYTQLKAGKFPAGKKWVRTTENFLKVFKYTERVQR